MTGDQKLYNIKYDLANCAEEPIQFIRACQRHACLLICYLPGLKLKAFSENCRGRFSVADGLRPGLGLDELVSSDTFSRIQHLVTTRNFDAGNPIIHNQRDGNGDLRRENLIIRQSGELLILEFEERQETVSSANFLQQVDQTLQRIQGARDPDFMLEATVEEVKQLTGFDRVMLYQFDEEYNGTVVAEAVEDDLPAFLHLRYPHTDIPEQARRLYLKQQVRQVVSTEADSYAMLISDDERSIDISSTDNRAVSPIHLEYLRNMGVGATLSVAIIMNGRLWGLIACHHKTSKLLDYRLRNLLGFFGRVISGHLALHQSTAFRMELLRTGLIRSRLVERMNESMELSGILNDPGDLLELTNSTGFALILGDTCQLTGACPREEELKTLLDFLSKEQKSVYHTSNLFDEFPASQDFNNRPAGLIAARLSDQPAEYLIWFRPEAVETVFWAGRPTARKTIDNGQVRLHPELSFAKWEASVSGKSLPWAMHQVDAVISLRNDIKEIVLQRFQEIRGLNEQLVDAYEELETFSYTVSHDLRAPLRSIKGYAEILQEDYSDDLDDEGKEMLSIIISNVQKMNQFISDILNFSRLGQSNLMIGEVSLSLLLDEVWREIQQGEKPTVRLRQNLLTDTVIADYTMIRQVILNLLGNAVKYYRESDDSWVQVSSKIEDGHVVLEVADNGIGFDEKHADRIFVVFNRLVPEDQYEGTGVGLAVVERIVGKHHGTIHVNSLLGEGTVFTIKIPINLADLLSIEDE